MASARCVHCQAVLQPNSMYCLGCGQLILRRPDAEGADSVASGWEPRPRRKTPAPAPEPPRLPQLLDEPAGRAAERGWGERVHLAFRTGEQVTITGEAVIGRKPGATAANIGAQAIEVDDPERSVSRVHAYLRLREGRLEALDAGSANGTSVERGDRRFPIPSTGEYVPLREGDVLWIGDVGASLTRQ